MLDLDPVFGINPNACPTNKTGPSPCAALPERSNDERVRVAMSDFFSPAEMAA